MLFSLSCCYYCANPKTTNSSRNTKKEWLVEDTTTANLRSKHNRKTKARLVQVKEVCGVLGVVCELVRDVGIDTVCAVSLSVLCAKIQINLGFKVANRCGVHS